jgi:hypothetical protein
LTDDATLGRVTAAFGRQMAACKQMRERSGPIYEAACERSRVISGAWRAAGSPRLVHRVRRGGVSCYVFWSEHSDPRTWEPATDAQVTAWYSWWRARDRLRRSLRAPKGQRG